MVDRSHGHNMRKIAQSINWWDYWDLANLHDQEKILLLRKLHVANFQDIEFLDILLDSMQSEQSRSYVAITILYHSIGSEQYMLHSSSFQKSLDLLAWVNIIDLSSYIKDTPCVKHMNNSSQMIQILNMVKLWKLQKAIPIQISQIYRGAYTSSNDQNFQNKK